AAQNRLELDRARLEFFSQIRELDSPPAGTDHDLENQIHALGAAVTPRDSSRQIRELDSPRAGTDDDLENQIDALEEAVPELKSSTAAPPVAVTATGPPSGAGARVQGRLALQGSRGRLEDLETATNELVQRVNEEAKAARARLRPMLTRLGALAKDPTDSGKSLDESQREFRDLLERRKLLVAVVLPLREELALARRYASDLK